MSSARMFTGRSLLALLGTGTGGEAGATELATNFPIVRYRYESPFQGEM
jgi:hypothetical protein